MGVYRLDIKDAPQELTKITSISIEYLTEADLVEIKNGIKVYTNKELNKILEDFE